jgi:hypothetical protein
MTSNNESDYENDEFSEKRNSHKRLRNTADENIIKSFSKDDIMKEYRELFHSDNLDGYPEKDITIICSNNVELKAHKFILQINSIYFRTLFNSGMIETVENVINKESIHPEIMKEILRYFYYGEFSILRDFDDIQLLLAIKEFEIKELEDKIIYMIKNNLTMDNACFYYQTCFAMDISKKLLKWSMKLIKENINSLKDNDLNILTRESFINLLSDHHFAITEENVFRLIMRKEKLEYNSSSKKTLELYSSCFSFSDMSTKFLLETIKPMNLFNDNEFYEIICHSINPSKVPDKKISIRKLLTNPTIKLNLNNIDEITEKNWDSNNSSFYLDSLRIQENQNVMNIPHVDVNWKTGDIYLLLKSTDGLNSDKLYVISNSQTGFHFKREFELGTNEYLRILINQNNGDIILYSPHKLTFLTENFKFKKEKKLDQIFGDTLSEIAFIYSLATDSNYLYILYKKTIEEYDDNYNDIDDNINIFPSIIIVNLQDFSVERISVGDVVDNGNFMRYSKRKFRNITVDPFTGNVILPNGNSFIIQKIYRKNIINNESTSVSKLPLDHFVTPDFKEVKLQFGDENYIVTTEHNTGNIFCALKDRIVIYNAEGKIITRLCNFKEPDVNVSQVIRYLQIHPITKHLMILQNNKLIFLDLFNL